MLPDEKEVFKGIAPDDDSSTLRDKINRLEETISGLEQVEFAVTHHFADGIYAREIFIPAGSVLTGKIHKTEHLNIISQGKISVVTESGKKTVTAPCTMVSPPGTKRAGFALEDTVWTTIHASKETDLALLEQELIAPDFDDLKILKTAEV